MDKSYRCELLPIKEVLELLGMPITSEECHQLEEIRTTINRVNGLRYDQRLGILEALIISADPLLNGLNGDKTPDGEGDIQLLEDVNVTSDQMAMAETNMFCSPWSSDFIHGADAIFPIFELASKILKPGEKITGLKKIAWKRPMKTNMRLTVCRNLLEIPKNASMEGVIETTEGNLVFHSTQIEKPITRNWPKNPYAEQVICDCPNCLSVFREGLYAYSLKEPPVENWENHMREHPPLTAALLTELVTMGISRMPCESSVLRLMGGIEGLELPKSPEDIFRAGVLEIQLQRKNAKTGRSGLQIIPFTFKFSYQRKKGSGFVALTNSEEVSNHHLKN
ncbi:MAG: hypothetical protein AB7J40_03630 [Candidatus Altimarinota bacterium]